MGDDVAHAPQERARNRLARALKHASDAAQTSPPESAQQLGDHELLLGVGHVGIEGQREREALGDRGAGEVFVRRS